MDAKSRKELRSRYMEREITGGVYAIKNKISNKLLVESTVDMQGVKNRFEFSQKTGNCIYHKLREDWAESGGGQFAFETLEELKKGDAQTQAEFMEDVALLKNMWLEKLSSESLY